MKKWILVLFAGVSIFSLFLVLLFNLVLTPRKYETLVQKYSQIYNLDESLVYSIIRVESNFDPCAKSSAGAMGLMQIMPATAAGIAKALGENIDSLDLFDAETNIKYGCSYLNYLFLKFQNLDAVICAYNAGEGNTRKWLNKNGLLTLDDIEFLETKNYLLKVKKYYAMYRGNV